MARRKPKPTCRERADGAVIHRTVTSPRGGQSRAELFVGPFARVVPSKAHRARIANARVARKLGRKRARAASRS